MVTVEWNNPEKTIILLKMVDPWNWEEFYLAQDEIMLMTETVSHRISFIIDVSQARNIPTNTMTHFRNLSLIHHPQHQIIVSVGSGALMTALGQILMKLVPSLSKRVYTAADFAEAYAIIAREASQPAEETPVQQPD